MISYEIAKNQQDLTEAFNLRNVVFVLEQNVPEDLELDEFDKDAIHVLAKDGDIVIGTGRMVIEQNKGRIGRMAVAQDWRRHGIGTALMKKLEEAAKQTNLSELYLHAQLHAKEFYGNLGYSPRGDIFDEAGIDHIEMFKLLT